MFRNTNILILIVAVYLMTTSCESFLDRAPLDSPSMSTFWENQDQAELWVNNLYNGLVGIEDSKFEAFSDNAWGRAGFGANNISTGIFDPNDADIKAQWDYNTIRECLEFFEKINNVKNIDQDKLNELSGQVNFILAYRYYRLITLYRDVPLVTETLNIDESDINKTKKDEVLQFVFERLDKAIEELPLTWESSENGRATKGAALALKARILLYNNIWEEAANTAKDIIDLNLYKLEPNFGDLFIESKNNSSQESILEYQYAENAKDHELGRHYNYRSIDGYAIIQPLPDLANSFPMIDGLSINESPLYNPKSPFENRDIRFYETFNFPGREMNGVKFDPINNSLDKQFTYTYLFFRKYVSDFSNSKVKLYKNWYIFRYADVLLMYAEAKNEASGPDDSIFETLDQIRIRSGLPLIDRNKYRNKEDLREFIRNERRCELAGEGLRYFDIIRWKIADRVMNKKIGSLEIPGFPIIESIETRVFLPEKHYVWPIPQTAIDQAKHLDQHTEWK